MKMDPLILGMTRGDVEIVLAVVIRDHLGCECVDRRDIEAHADHLADEVAAMLETPPDIDGIYSEFVNGILNKAPR